MLQLLNSKAFTPLITKTGTMTTDTGIIIPIQVMEVTEKSRSTPKYHAPDRRVPFSVLMTSSLTDLSWLHGMCTIQLDGLDTIEKVYVVRIISQDENPENAWYQMVFN